MMTKNQFYGQMHQVGVYATTILDSIGTVIKYAVRLTSGQKYQIRGSLTSSPFSPDRFIAGMFGMGSIMGAMAEAKLVKALSSDGLIVAQGDNGKLALANAGTGEIVISGPASMMKGVIQTVGGIKFAGPSGGLGEDISVES